MDQGEEKEKSSEEKTSEKPAVKGDVKLFNAAQAAFELGLTKADITRLREEGKLPGIKGRWGRWYYHPDALSAVIPNTSSTPTTPTETPAEQPSPSKGISLPDIMKELGTGTSQDNEANSDEEAYSEKAPIVRMNNAIIVMGIDFGASDIHIEADSRNVRVRCRIDGIMHEIMKTPKHIQGPMTQRFKIMADLNILERRIPQIGSIWVKHCGRDYNLRVTTIPSTWGENVTIHVFEQDKVMLGLNKLTMASDVQAGIEDIANSPSGLILIAGPSGSGITTTAYSLLHKINSIRHKIVTLETIPEYTLGGLIQSYYGGRYKNSLSETLRLLPLMDVDTLFLGDINTHEALSSASEVALSGKQVIATMAAEDACMALWRLSQLSLFTEKKPERQQTYSLLPRYQSHLEKAGQPLLQTVLGVLSQRLVRKVCPDCREPHTMLTRNMVAFGFSPHDVDEEVTIFRGKGCDTCRGTGYKGRVGIFELLSMNYEIAALATLHAPLTDIHEAARANGMQDMREDALMKILNGLTTPEEVLRVLGRPKNTR